jgi:hypothetical protein
MILYNVTVNIEHNIEAEWLQWMQEKHIPDVLATGYFSNNKICKMLSGEHDGGVTYSIQYLCKDEAMLNEYQEKHAPALQKEHTEKYAGKFVAFRSLLEVIANTDV